MLCLHTHCDINILYVSAFCIYLDICDIYLLLDCNAASTLWYGAFIGLHYCVSIYLALLSRCIASSDSLILMFLFLDRNSLLGDKVGHVGGTAFTNVVPRQQNICLTIARGIEGTTALVADCLKRAACRLEHVLRIPFEMSTRTLRGFHFVKWLVFWVIADQWYRGHGL